MGFESISSEHNEGTTMYRTKTKAVRRVAVATTLGLGLVGGVAGIAAAGGSVNSHDATTTTAAAVTVSGVVTGYVAATSISVLSAGSVTPTSYTLDANTTITGLATGASAPPVGDTVTLTLPTSASTTVTSISVATPVVTPPAVKVEGTVVAFVAGTSISVSTKGSTLATVYTLNSYTTITGLATGVSAPAVGDIVDLTLSTTTNVVVLSISDLGAPVAPVSPVVARAYSDEDAMQVEGTVTAFVAGVSISVMSGDAATPTLYTLDANTTITGLAAGVTAPVIGDRVHLTMSAGTTPVVLSIRDQFNEGTSDEDSSGQGNTAHSNSDHGNSGRGNSDHGNGGRGNSDHGNWNNSGSSVGSFNNGGFNAGGSSNGSSDN